MINLIGQKFGKLTVIKYSHTDRYRQPCWECECECGNIKIIIGRSLRTGKTKTCGKCRYIDLTGQKFGMLTVIRYSHSNNGAYWECECDCGNILVRSAMSLNASLINNYISNCGCTSNSIIHGLTDHPLHSIWEDMKKRCFNPNRKEYKNYGSRGITIFDGWLYFENFFLDMIQQYSIIKEIYPFETLSIERLNYNKNYEPGNCIILLHRLQGRNRRVNKLNEELAEEIRIKYSSNNYTRKMLADEYNVSIVTIGKVISGDLWNNFKSMI